jgi:uncharacterized protein (TIGR02117 family)
MAERRQRRRIAIRSLQAALLALLLALAVTAKGGDRRLYPAPPGAPNATIFLIDNGFHTDLVVPRAAVIASGGALATAVQATTRQPWIMLGWGDARFYTAQGFSSARTLDALRALFAPRNPSVVHVEGLDRAPDHIWRDGVRPIRLSGPGLRGMLRHIDGSLLAGPAGAAVPAPAPAEPDGAFFKSVEHFSIIHLCNHWTAQVLNAAGLPVTPVLDTLPAGMMLDLRLRAGVR